MKKKTEKTVKVKVSKIHPAVTRPIWLARDADGELCLYAQEPYQDRDGRWYPKNNNNKGHKSLWDYVTDDIQIIVAQLFGSLPSPGECWRIEI